MNGEVFEAMPADAFVSLAFAVSRHWSEKVLSEPVLARAIARHAREKEQLVNLLYAIEEENNA